MGMPAVVWRSCGRNFGYRIPLSQLMANGVWPRGADMQLLYPQQKFIWLISEGILARHNLKIGPRGSASVSNVPKGCVHVACIDHFVYRGAIDAPAPIDELLEAWSEVAGYQPTEVEVPRVSS